MSLPLSGDFCPYPALPPPVEVKMVTVSDKPCVYLPDRVTTLRAFHAGRIAPTIYHQFMDAGFRRSGRIIYQPVCRGCRACLPIRVPVADFAPDKSQRRCRKRNQDLSVAVARADLTDEKWDLYRRYLAGRHGGPMESDRDSLAQFLYESPVQTVEFTYRDPAGRLLAVGICDVCPLSVSSVYFFFDPAESRRGLGNFGALTEIAFAAARRIPHWYIGYWVKGCAAMEYKSSFHPHEILHPDGVWRVGD
jgi:arginyl-tRNA--protein-N-Asp/Glu arginylyltransferase